MSHNDCSFTNTPYGVFSLKYKNVYVSRACVFGHAVRRFFLEISESDQRQGCKARSTERRAMHDGHGKRLD